MRLLIDTRCFRFNRAAPSQFHWSLSIVYLVIKFEFTDRHWKNQNYVDHVKKKMYGTGDKNVLQSAVEWRYLWSSFDNCVLCMVLPWKYFETVLSFVWLCRVVQNAPLFNWISCSKRFFVHIPLWFTSIILFYFRSLNIITFSPKFEDHFWCWNNYTHTDTNTNTLHLFNLIQ